MKQGFTKPTKKKLVLKKTTIAKFVMSSKQLKAVNGGYKIDDTGDAYCGGGGTTQQGVE